ncbi:MAG: IS66 family insertion sequence element accessory protein TnpB [Eggerthellaceae bacterium]|nr:IS66 family insertion sequence element accessory protein TnpB [Eggerthellaceae bacterium]
MNPFVAPEHIYISTTPRDMRAGIEKLAYVVTTSFRRDPTDGSLYVFLSRDLKNMKAIRYEDDAWVLYNIKLFRGAFKWKHLNDGDEEVPHY